MTGDFYSRRCACGRAKDAYRDECWSCFVRDLAGLPKTHAIVPRSHTPVVQDPEGGETLDDATKGDES